MQSNSSDTEWVWRLDRTIPSEPTLSSELVNELLARFKAEGWTEHEIFSLHMALEEAMMNAIKHGNGGDAEKTVQVTCHLSEQHVEIRVTDEGSGFNPEEVPDPTAEENLDKDSGRGLLLMKSFMTEVEFNDRGNSVWMRKHKETKSTSSDSPDNSTSSNSTSSNSTSSNSSSPDGSSSS